MNSLEYLWCLIRKNVAKFGRWICHAQWKYLDSGTNKMNFVKIWIQRVTIEIISISSSLEKCTKKKNELLKCQKHTFLWIYYVSSFKICFLHESWRMPYKTVKSPNFSNTKQRIQTYLLHVIQVWKLHIFRCNNINSSSETEA